MRIWRHNVLGICFKGWINIATRLGIFSLVLITQNGFFNVAQEITCPSPDLTNSIKGTIAFISDREGSQQIYSMDADGSNVTRITDFEDANLSDLDWSPTGKHIAFTNDSDIFVMNVENHAYARLTTNAGEDYAPAWSPDGRRIAYISDRGGPYDVWIMTIKGRNVGAITSDPRWEMTVDWITDGTGIAFVPNSGANLEIWLEPLSFPFEFDTPLLFEDYDYSEPVLHDVRDLNWSPNGEYLSLQTGYGAYTINVNGTDLKQIEPRESYIFSGAPSWSPDNCQLAFASNEDRNSEIYIFNLSDGTRQRLTSNNFNDFSPVWRPTQPNNDAQEK